MRSFPHSVESGVLHSPVSGGPRGDAGSCVGRSGRLWRTRQRGAGAGRCSLGPFARGAGLPPPAPGRLQPLRNVCAGRWVHFLVPEPLGGPARPPLPPARSAQASALGPGALHCRGQLLRAAPRHRPQLGASGPIEPSRAGAARASRTPEVTSAQLPALGAGGRC